MVKSFSPVELDQLLHTASQLKRPDYESQNASSRMRWYFVFFVVSGFCSLVYEVVWLRLAMARFGVTTAMASIVVSMFMAGLGLGSWGTGVLVRRVAAAPRMLCFYALAEFLVGISALFVPHELKLGRALLEVMSTSAAWQSSRYYFLSSLWVAVTMVPWCTCMGSTFPLLMAVIRQMPDAESVQLPIRRQRFRRTSRYCRFRVLSDRTNGLSRNLACCSWPEFHPCHLGI